MVQPNKVHKTGSQFRASKPTGPLQNPPVLSVELQPGLQTPCKQMAQLELRSNPKKSKLLGSKSFSQLIQKGLFFKKSRSSQGSKSQNTSPSDGRIVAQLTTARSFPSSSLHSSFLPELKDRVASDSLIVLPGRSTNKEPCNQQRMMTSLDQASLSPIVYNSSPLELSSQSSENQSVGNRPDADSTEGGESSKEKKIKKLRPLKTTKMALRDVKNSLSLRMRAKQDNQAFTKLSNEATPATKLYSPFNIYTDSVSKTDKRIAYKSGADDSMISFQDEEAETKETSKRRVALQHKKHLLQTNQFNFVSPTGKLKETIKDVEHFQQCIEDISKAIQRRDRDFDCTERSMI